MTEPPATPGGSPDWGEMKGKMMAARGADRMILVAGLLFLVDSFLPWYGADLGIVSVNAKGWSSGGLAVLSILFALGALLLAATQVAGMKMTLPMKTGMAYLILGGGAFVFALLRFITETNLTKFGLYIAIVLGAVLAYAGYMKYKAEGAAGM
jgi:hypothetical protein